MEEEEEVQALTESPMDEANTATATVLIQHPVTILITRQERQESITETEMRNADEILERLGPGNRYSMYVLVVMSIVWTLGAMSMMVSAFIAEDLPCDNDDGRSNKTCSEGRISIVSQFNLTGPDQNLAQWSTSAFMIGSMIGGMLLTNLSDRIGRLPVLVGSLSVLGIFGCAASKSSTIWVFAGFRFLQGTFYTGSTLANWVLAYESICVSTRAYGSLIMGTFWVLGYCALAPLAYYIHDWRDLIITVSLPCCIIALLIHCTVPESLHFLVTKSKRRRAIQWLNKAEFYSGKCLNVNPEKLFDYMEEIQSRESPTDQSKLTRWRQMKGGLREHKLLCVYIAVFIYMWTSDTFVYFGLSLHSTRLAGNHYLNYVLSGLVEMPAYICAPFLLNRLGRKPVVSGSHFIAGASLLGLLLLPEGYPTLVLSLWLLGKFAISCAFICIFVYASEVFPTSVRNGTIGICAVTSRLGGIVAPHVRTLEMINPALPMLICGSLSFLGGILTLILPETLNRQLISLLSEVKR